MANSKKNPAVTTPTNPEETNKVDQSTLSCTEKIMNFLTAIFEKGSDSPGFQRFALMLEEVDRTHNPNMYIELQRRITNLEFLPADNVLRLKNIAKSFNKIFANKLMDKEFENASIQERNRLITPYLKAHELSERFDECDISDSAAETISLGELSEYCFWMEQQLVVFKE